MRSNVHGFSRPATNMHSEYHRHSKVTATDREIRIACEGRFPRRTRVFATSAASRKGLIVTASVCYPTTVATISNNKFAICRTINDGRIAAGESSSGESANRAEIG